MNTKESRIVVLACGKGACCPKAVLHADGSVDLVDTDDGKNEEIKLSPEQAKMLGKLLTNH
jgi:hypothetical protein